MSAFSPKTLATIARVSIFIFRLLRKLHRVASLAWWMYIVVILSLFFGGLLLNYIVKKINEARLGNRFISLRNKASANQSTQVQRTMEIDKKPITPLINTTQNINERISPIFNKEENLLEDKRRKEDLPKPSKPDSVVIAMNSSENIADVTATMHSARDVEMNKSVFLGTIYKDLYEKRVAIEKSKSLSNADRDSILNEIVDKMVWQINESKSTPSIRKLIDTQNENVHRALDLIMRDEAQASPSTSGTCS